MARDYQEENKYKKQPAQIKKRVQRNKGRRLLKAKVGAAALVGKEVHHDNGRTADNRLSNLKAVEPSSHNYGRAGSQGGKLKKGGK